MAVTKALTTAVPYNLNSKVQRWQLGMTYNQGSKSASPSTYYESTFNVTVPLLNSSPGVNLTVVVPEEERVFIY